MTVSVSQSAVVTTTSWTRWIQLGLGFVAMMSISSPQYVWTLFTKPFQDQLGVPLSAIQITFSILIVLQTWLSPLQGFLVDKFGPRLLIAVGCAMSGAGWITSAYITSLWGLFLTYFRRQLGQLGGDGAAPPEHALIEDGDWSRHPAFQSVADRN